MGCCMSKPKVGTDEHAMRKDYYQKMQKKENNGQQTTEHQAQSRAARSSILLAALKKRLKEFDAWQDDGEISIPAGKFKNESKAFVTIFNQETFANSKQNRYGSGNDVKSLKRAFQQYNHEPEVNQNFTLNEIARKMEILSKTDFPNCKLYMSIFLSHGNTNGFVSASDGSFDHKRLIDPIMTNESLKMVPKIFIFLASQETCKNSSDFSVGSRIANYYDYDISHDKCMKCYSTYEGPGSHRKGDGTGSYFINELCALITQFPMDSFQNIMAKLNGRLKQTPVFTTKLGEFSLSAIK